MFGDEVWQARSTNHAKATSGCEDSVSLRRLLRLLSLDFVSAMAVEGRGGLTGHGRILLSVDLARSQLFFVNLLDGVLLSGLIPQVSEQKRNSNAEPWGRVQGQPELWLKIGAYGHRKPNILSLHPATERPYLRTGLRLRVTMCVCHLCGPRAMVGSHRTHRYPLH